jgi:peptidoglycan/LPS O-acetylase OafA/YrhL
MLAVFSVRFTDQPQRWAAAPALVMGLGGLLLVGFGAPVDQVLNWVWPPAMLALAVWMLVCVHRQLQSRLGRWLLYPVIALLALASPTRTLAAVPSDRAAGAGLDRWRLPDPG